MYKAKLAVVGAFVPFRNLLVFIITLVVWVLELPALDVSEKRILAEALQFSEKVIFVAHSGRVCK